MRVGVDFPLLSGYTEGVLQCPEERNSQFSNSLKSLKALFFMLIAVLPGFLVSD